MPKAACPTCLDLQLLYSQTLRHYAEAMHERVIADGKVDKEAHQKLDETINEAGVARVIARRALEAHIKAAHPESNSELSPVSK